MCAIGLCVWWPVSIVLLCLVLAVRMTDMDVIVCLACILCIPGSAVYILTSLTLLAFHYTALRLVGLTTLLCVAVVLGLCMSKSGFGVWILCVSDWFVY